MSVTATSAAPLVAMAETIHLPPVVISELLHGHSFANGYTSTYDAVTFPCVSDECNGPGWTASFGMGDVLVLRFEAPAGHKFNVTRGPGTIQTFFCFAGWYTGTNDPGSNFSLATLTFENLQGPAPTRDFYAWDYLTDNGQFIYVAHELAVTADFEFTALEIQFTVTHELADVSRTYGEVLDVPDSGPSFGSGHAIQGSGSDFNVMEIVPIPQCVADSVPEGGDGHVTIADITNVLSAFGLPCADCPQDIMPQPDGDNAVTIADVTAVLTAFGPCEG
jgi:hypothetical protein